MNKTFLQASTKSSAKKDGRPPAVLGAGDPGTASPTGMSPGGVGVGHSDAQAHNNGTEDAAKLTFPGGVADIGNTQGGGPKSDGRSYGKK